MNCQPCKSQDHKHCIDVAKDLKISPASKLMDIGGEAYPIVAGRLYRSCFCQHQVIKRAEPATGPAGE